MYLILWHISIVSSIKKNHQDENAVKQNVFYQVPVPCFNAQNPKCLSGTNTWLLRFEVKCQTSKPSEAKGTVNHNLRKI